MYVLYYTLMLRCWNLVWILVRTNHPCLGVGHHNLISTIPKVDIPTVLGSAVVCFELHLIAGLGLPPSKFRNHHGLFEL
jgi:hypothetical protein